MAAIAMAVMARLHRRVFIGFPPRVSTPGAGSHPDVAKGCYVRMTMSVKYF
jgi:hypothetical protein